MANLAPIDRHHMNLGRYVAALGAVGDVTIETTLAQEWCVTVLTPYEVPATCHHYDLLRAMTLVLREVFAGTPMYQPKTDGKIQINVDKCAAAVLEQDARVKQCSGRGAYIGEGGVRWCKRHMPETTGTGE